MATSTASSYQPVQLRPCAEVFRVDIPEHYRFLETAATAHKYRINFRHPAYPAQENILFTLYAWDHPDGGLHSGLAHNACSIIANNCANGYLTKTWTITEEGGERVDAGPDDVLPTAVADYYYYVPYPEGIF